MSQLVNEKSKILFGAASNVLQGAKYLWILPAEERALIAQIAADCNLSLPVAQTLVVRGFRTKTEIENFLFCTYEKNVSHTSLMKDANKAVDRILAAIEAGEKILVFGDYDVDGITSSALMMMCLPRLGAKINFCLPNRKKDGYGLSTKFVRQAAKSGYQLIITVDNGITAFEPALVAKELGVDLIITDHHRQHDHLPDAYAIVNPNQNDCSYPNKFLAGVGVTFKILSLIYERKNLELPHKVYELLMLGTIADVVPLLGENRFWVQYGLNLANQTQSLAFQVLKQNGKVEKPVLTATDIGFSLTPQINALGRLEDPREGVRFLIDSNADEVQRVGQILLALNQARKDVERVILDEIEQKIRVGEIDLANEKIIIATSANWPTGVIGLVASRLVGKYGKPTLLFHLTADGFAKGSCRSIPEFSIFDALEASRDLIEQFGGHSQAAGLALKIENLPKLKAKLEALAAAKLTEFDLKPKIVLDGTAQLADFNKKFMQDLAILEPFGHHNSCPLFFVVNVVQVQPAQLMKEQHVKLQIFAEGAIKSVVFFYRPELYQLFVNHEYKPFSLAVQVSENHWQGRVNIELIGIDVYGLGSVN
jgi:single-stranded-DNA-specific exonuclease